MWQYEPPAPQGYAGPLVCWRRNNCAHMRAGVLAFAVRKFEFCPPIHGSRLGPVLRAYVAPCGLSNERPLRLRSGSVGSPTMEHSPNP
jgi:hypothetical protein